MKTNTLSIISFVTGLLGLAIVPIITGHVSLAQIKRTGEGGKVLAIIGLVLGYLEVVAFIGLIILWVVVASTGRLVIE